MPALVDPSPDRQRAAALLLERLLAGVSADGSWSARPGVPGGTEPTALAALAVAARNPAVARRALAWLAARQRADGSWPATAQPVDAPSWAGGVALLATARLAGDPAVVDRGAAWLLRREGAGLGWRAELDQRWRRMRGLPQVNDVDVSLRGWPWIDGTFSWVEPTSVAVLALHAAAARRSGLARDERFRERTAVGVRLLVDRAVPGGGWNYGNTRVLGEVLEPYPDTTAWALLALRAAPRDAAGVSRVVAEAFGRLPALMRGNASPLSQALLALALRAHGRDDSTMADPLAARVLSAGPPGDVRSQGLALLALGGPAVPFGP